MSLIYEVVRSRLHEGAEERMLAARPPMIRAVRERFPALVDATLVRLDDGTWLDIVRWSSREEAERAAAAFPEIPECRAMGEHIAEILSFEHGLAAEPAP